MSSNNDVTLRPSTRRRASKVKVAQLSSHEVKCVVLGDGDVGKSSMLVTYLSGSFPQDCPPGPIDGHSEYDHLSKHATKLKESNYEVNMTFVDTYGQDEYERLRERICVSADVYMLCFDVSKHSTFERLHDHWIPEMRRYSPESTPFIVVGLKTDIRTKAQASGEDVSRFMTYSEGMRAAAELGAVHYVECSAKNNTSVKRVLEKAAHAAVQNSLMEQGKGRTSCVVA